MAKRFIVLNMIRGSLTAFLPALFVFLLLLPAGSAHSEEQAKASVQIEFDDAQKELATKDMAAGDPEITVIKDSYADAGYVPPTLENLSKLYWRLQVFNAKENEPIDNFLKINDCEIYSNFFTDDFEWHDIRATTRKMLAERAPTYPNTFKVLVPIDLGRYIVEKGGFDIVNHTAFENSRRVKITSGAKTNSSCVTQSKNIAGYPDDVILILNKPFTFDFIKVDEHVAQAFLLRKKYNSDSLPHELSSRGFQRPAYARMRVSFARYHSNVKDAGGSTIAILYGKLDGIDVFEDPTEEMLITSIDFK